MRGVGKIFHHEMKKIIKEKSLLFGFILLPVLTLFITVGISLLQPKTSGERVETYSIFFTGSMSNRIISDLLMTSRSGFRR